MRVALPGSVVLLVLSACADIGAPTRATGSGGMAHGQARTTDTAPDSTYRTFLRQRDTVPRGSVPFSVPPETPGMPLAAPMHDAGPPAAEPAPTIAATDAPENTPANAHDDEPAAELAAAAGTLRPDPEGPSFGVPTNLTDEVPLIRVETVPTGVDGGANVIAYALRTTHAVGTERHTRRNPLRWQLWERNCLQFADQNTAQEAFLAAGGPERDRHNLDPDGDGYACWWDPEPIRRAMRAAAN